MSKKTDLTYNYRGWGCCCIVFHSGVFERSHVEKRLGLSKLAKSCALYVKFRVPKKETCYSQSTFKISLAIPYPTHGFVT